MEAIQLFRIQTVFKPMRAIIESTIFAFIVSILISLVLGTVILIISSLFGFKIYPHMILFVLSFLCLLPLYYEVKMRSVKKTKYDFFTDHLEFEYYLPFRGRNKGILEYNQVEQMLQRSSFIQQRMGLKTIYFYAPALQVIDRKGFAGLKLIDIPSGQDWGKRIEELIYKKPSSNQPVAELVKEQAGNE